MNIKQAGAALAASILLPVVVFGQATGPTGKYAKWLDQEVAYIISPAERQAFLTLTADGDRDLFIEEFWRHRDPTPGTPDNEFRTEHYRRIDFADSRFGAGRALPGWRTDRGRTLIILGPPFDIQRVASADTVPIEIWYYLTDLRSDLATYFRLVFFQEYGADEYKLYNPETDGPKRLVPFPDRWRPARNIVPGEEAADRTNPPAAWTAADNRAYQILATYVTSEVAEASVSCFPGFSGAADAARSRALIEGLADLPRKRVDVGWADKFLKTKAPVDVSYSVQPVDCRADLTVGAAAAGGYPVTYALGPRDLAVDYFGDHYLAGVRTTIRVKDAVGKTAFEAVRFTPVALAKMELEAVSESSPEVRGTFTLGPGEYTVDLLFEDTVAKGFAAVTKKVMVPQAAGAKAAGGEAESAVPKPARGLWIIPQ
jgi:GWxTD domain-containing protein